MSLRGYVKTLVLLLGTMCLLLSGCDFTQPKLIPRKVLFGNPVKASPQISPDGKQMAYIAPKDKLYIMGGADDNPFKKEASAMQSMEDIMIKKGEHEKTFYISDSHETKILNSLKWKCIGGIGGGALLIIGSLFILVLTIMSIYRYGF